MAEIRDPERPGTGTVSYIGAKIDCDGCRFSRRHEQVGRAFTLAITHREETGHRVIVVQEIMHVFEPPPGGVTDG